MDKLYYLNKLFLKVYSESPPGSYIKNCCYDLYNQFKDISFMEELPFAFQSFEFKGEKIFETSIVNYPIVNVDWSTPDNTPVDVVVTADFPYPTTSNRYLCIHIFEFNGEKELFFVSKVENTLHFVCSNKKYNGQHHIVSNGNWIQAFEKIDGYNINPRHIATITLTHESSQKYKSNFRLLSPIQNGVAEFHVNHFIGYFKLKNKANLLNLNQFFFNYFVEIFNPNIALAKLYSNKKFQGNKTIKFTINLGPGHYIHDDWISVQFDDGSKSFFAKTLKREWIEFIDLTPILLPPPLNSSQPIIQELNQRHFLAGRRSWKIGYLADEDLYYIETPAFERYSHIMYKQGEDLLELRDSIPKIWIKLIENFSNRLNISFEEHNLDLLKGYDKSNNNIYYIRNSNSSWQDLFSLPWFKEVSNRHPGLST